MNAELAIAQVLPQIKHVHMIGIGGAGMCPLAEILHAWGYALTGSDTNESETLARVRALGIPVELGQRAANVQGAEAVIFTAALLPNNPELLAAKAAGLPVFERAALLGYVANQYPNSICVAGTHGKTTTSALLAQMFLDAGRDPSAVIGGRLPALGRNGLAGKSPHMICEACEYQDTYLQLEPNIAVLLNVDEDHMEYFKTRANLLHSFATFAGKAKACVIYNADDPNTCEAMRAVPSHLRRVTFGREAKCTVSAQNVTMHGAFAQFDWYQQGRYVCPVQLKMPGLHNVDNALAALAAALESGLTVQECLPGLKGFGGAGRRFEVLLEHKGITIADDYAHHPKEITAVLTAAKAMPFARVIAVFQPFTFSRTARLLQDFAKSLALANEVLLLPIMGAREVNTYGIASEDLAALLPQATLLPDFASVATHLQGMARTGDLILTIGCGDVYKATKPLLAAWGGLKP